MTVRMAHAGDIGEILEKGERFCMAAGYSDFSGTDAHDFALQLVREGAVFLTEGGVLGALLAPLPWCRAHIQAVELFWWSEDGHGLDLVRAFERWGRERAKTLVFSTVEMDQRASEIMGRLGYRLREMSWVKEAA